MKQKNQLVNLVVSMTSLEIAEMTGKEHKNVLRDIEVMLVELRLPKNEPSSESQVTSSFYINSQNKKQPMFILPRRETLILVSGYSIELRTKIIDR